MRFSAAEQMRIREDIFGWLDKQMVAANSHELSRELLQSYKYKNRPIKLLDQTSGIWNPRELDVSLSVMTSIKANVGYDDEVQANGLIRYSLENSDPDKGKNKKLLDALGSGTPLIYFKMLRPGFYEANYPVYVQSFNVEEKAVYLEPDENFRLYGEPQELVVDRREYVERAVKQRRHQRMFRAEVLSAYNVLCSVCEIKHYALIDAAHIIADSEIDGISHVTNGLSLCKLHHTAYDRNIIGIDPNFEIKIREDILDDANPAKSMKVNFIDLHNKPLIVPDQISFHPNRDFLARRFREFTG